MILKNIFPAGKQVIFGKAMDNLRKHGQIKLVSTGVRSMYLKPEPNYWTTIFFRKFISHSIEINR